MDGEISSVLCFDLDGTIVDPEGEFPLDLTLLEYLRELKSQGAVWVVNTGRTLFQTLEGFHQHGITMLPDYIIAQESELYKPGKFNRWIPFGEWNATCASDHKKFFRGSSRAFNKLCTEVGPKLVQSCLDSLA